MSPDEWDGLPWHEQISLVDGLDEAGLLPGSDGTAEGQGGGKVVPFESLGIPVRQIGGG